MEREPLPPVPRQARRPVVLPDGPWLRREYFPEHRVKTALQYKTTRGELIMRSSIPYRNKGKKDSVANFVLQALWRLACRAKGKRWQVTNYYRQAAEMAISWKGLTVWKRYCRAVQ